MVHFNSVARHTHVHPPAASRGNQYLPAPSRPCCCRARSPPGTRIDMYGCEGASCGDSLSGVKQLLFVVFPWHYPQYFLHACEYSEYRRCKQRSVTTHAG